MSGGWGQDWTVDRRIVPVHRLGLAFEPGGWSEMAPRRGEIEAHFARRAADNPHLWNGPILLLARHDFTDGVLSGAFRQTDFAAFTFWRDEGWKDEGMVNAFALAAIEGSDGGFVLGVMGPHTASAGRIYFPGGTPDPSDITPDNRVDLHASMLRELTEETGLLPADILRDDGFTGLFDGPRVALMGRLVFDAPAEDLAARIRTFLAAEAEPELADVAVVKSEADLAPAMAPFAVDYMRWRWAGN
ncbi:8-oxo-dGTP pyrophosphatase MutT (NUDIX family) [Xanthobacter sp. SG618]|uniref:NUDIX hydrolase n=1 Tax=Xanthobacter sp. SG618 TaxID=2587121 RepID=UPI00145D2DA8|nr:NUDIX hydrolase [Xanthobacter sp. SG618]NMN59945.1 8-oxo-dGTP pyrophosphatase MutT (NUDIX family) [Xanthobacter sp. SG618]